MASLVAPLVSGISTAASGSALFFRAGTSTTANVYSDAEGETQVTSHALDARGAVVRYVEERVDVVVRDLNGATITSFTWGTDARDARVENTGWTGPDGDGQTIAGGRTTVDAALTRLANSLGTTDGNVLVNGVATTLSLALSSSAGLVYNVKSGYGAVGNGTTDDSGAIQDALNAAATAGGGIIYFPHGTYLINTGLVVGSGEGKFTYLGESATGSKLKQGTSGSTMLTLGASNDNLLLGLTFTATAANTGTLVSVGSGSRATFLACAFDPLDGTQVALANTQATVATLVNCIVSQAGASSRIATGGNSPPSVRLEACDISTAGADLTSFLQCRVSLIGCITTMGSAIAAGTTQLMSQCQAASIIGGHLESLYTSGTVAVGETSTTLMMSGVRVVSAATTLALAGASSSTVFEAACQLTSTNVIMSVGGNANGYSATRDHRTTVSSGSFTSYTPSGDFMVHEVASTGATMTFNNPSPTVPLGSSLVILYKNSGATANITPSFGSAYSFVQAPSDVDAGMTAIYVFTPRAGNGTITTDLIGYVTQTTGGTAL